MDPHARTRICTTFFFERCATVPALRFRAQILRKLVTVACGSPLRKRAGSSILHDLDGYIRKESITRIALSMNSTKLSRTPTRRRGPRSLVIRLSLPDSNHANTERHLDRLGVRDVPSAHSHQRGMTNSNSEWKTHEAAECTAYARRTQPLEGLHMTSGT